MALSPLTPIEDDESRVISVSDSVSPTKTYELKDGYIGGFIDGDSAIQQTVAKALRTARYRFLVYDDDYGSEIEDLIAQQLPMELLELEIPRVIKDALTIDDRISDVVDFVISQEGDALYVTFKVVTVNGDELNGEVTI
jgi:hypothetical protein